ncbi:MAG: hypothetical protein AAF990_28535 [Bacteroidota bacterium]
MTEKRRLFRPIEVIAFLIGVALLLYIVMRQNGISLIERSEHVEIYRPSSRTENSQPLPRPSVDERQEEVDEALEQLAARISDDNKADWKAEVVEGLDGDEQRYLETVGERYQGQDQLQNARDWLKVLRGSYRTYDKVRSIFGESNGEAEALDRLKSSFDVPPEEVEAFARLGKQKLSDWATFLEEYATSGKPAAH